MDICPLPLDGLKIIQTAARSDERGSFERLFCTNELEDLIGSRNIAQINYSVTAETGTVRGIHFQHSPNAEMKLIRCIKGRVWDVAIDLRKNSPTFLQWHGCELSSENKKMIVIPEGFGHGFQTLEPESELLYLHTTHYVPSSEGGLRFNDPRLNITWPLMVSKISERDNNHALINDNFHGIHI
jgi:dTDP-4-dehydrorhamnose 3,5-epimerase